jgi:hypothetical protein
MMACVQKVYEKASSIPAATPAPRELVMLAVSTVNRPTAAAAQSAEARAKVEEARALFERGDRRGEIGDRNGRLALYRDGLARVDEAIALGDNRPEVLFGRRELGLQFGEMLLEAERADQSLAAFGAVAQAAGGAGDAIPEDRQDRLHLARALRGMVQASVAMRDLDGARTRLRRLLAVGRAMRAAEPDNLYLTRRLAEDLQDEVFFRWVTEDAAGSRETALEALALFRSVDEANPGSDEAMRSHFRWAYAAAALHDSDPALWREALEVGTRLETRGEMGSKDRQYMRVVRLRAGE